VVTTRGAWIAAVVTLACAVIEADALSDRRRGEPANDGLRRYVLGEIVEGLRVEQQFLVKADGFSSVTIHPRPFGGEPAGAATLELRDVTDDPEGSDPAGLVAQATVPLAELIAEDGFTLRFAPRSSWYRAYRLVVTVSGAERGQGVGLLATRGEGHRDARLRVGSAVKWGDLVFETTVGGARSNFELMSAHLRAAGLPAPSGVLTALLALQYAALFFTLRSLVAFVSYPG
jgi:hypothetical protein